MIVTLNRIELNSIFNQVVRYYYIEIYILWGNKYGGFMPT
ncbi:hypothetical protein FORC066_4029 [Yersinia enterocolitica]|nr:hypothetical protein FORC066_4029 [Yersinia enterocolitica]